MSGAWLIAQTARLTQQNGLIPSWPELLAQNNPSAGLPSPHFYELLNQAWASHVDRQTTPQFIRHKNWDNGPTGFVQHTVVAALHMLWSCPGSLENAVRSTVRLGGDTDSIAAVVAAIAHLDPQRGPLPSPWRAGLPDDALTLLSTTFLGDLEDAARCNTPIPLPTLFWPRMLGRNARMTALVLTHGLGRLLPPGECRPPHF